MLLLPMPRRIEILDSADAIAEMAVGIIAECARISTESRGRFTVALAGGSTPERTYRLLANPQTVKPIDWSRVFVFFGDERFVPHDDERSNYAMAKRSLLDHVPVPADQVFPIETALPTVKDAARDYASLLSRELGDPPVFDLILLGMGDDGHTASLFPHAAALDITTTWAADSPPGILPPPVDRITITYPVMRAAEQILFLVAGENKAEAVRDVLQNAADLHDRPSAGAIPDSGHLTWLLDKAAANLIAT
jgi:6-phosphogluconolactonase